MRIKTIEGFEVSGFRTRTITTNEMNQETAKIGSLWQRFSSEAACLLSENSKVYGIYTNYQSGISGEYDVFAAADTLNGQALEGIHTVNVPSGKYLVFSATGPMPKVCMDLWGEIWNYFASDTCIHKQAFTADFEEYKTSSMENCELDIYVSIK